MRRLKEPPQQAGSNDLEPVTLNTQIKGRLCKSKPRETQWKL